MKYFISTKESKRNENGLIPVSVIFRDNRKEFAVSTGIMAKYPVNGVSFAQNEPNEDKTACAYHRRHRQISPRT